ncbi:hypothetical protein ACQQCD_06595 [Pseudarthrobacter sp. J1763]|jgi:hypothetical protein|uniref:hypothetical protein n=1 Tax=Pseudarthrobacter sp. J1763 TaxID=3420445 RepID=UPI003D2E06A0
MPTSHITQFLLEATIPDQTQEPLGSDCLYGLYTSWCILHRISPLEARHFRDALQHHGVEPGKTRRRIAGPAAADYIISSYPPFSSNAL